MEAPLSLVVRHPSLEQAQQNTRCVCTSVGRSYVLAQTAFSYDSTYGRLLMKMNLLHTERGKETAVDSAPPFSPFGLMYHPDQVSSCLHFTHTHTIQPTHLNAPYGRQKISEKSIEFDDEKTIFSLRAECTRWSGIDMQIFFCIEMELL